MRILPHISLKIRLQFSLNVKNVFKMTTAFPSIVFMFFHKLFWRSSDAYTATSARVECILSLTIKVPVTIHEIISSHNKTSFLNHMLSLWVNMNWKMASEFQWPWTRPHTIHKWGHREAASAIHLDNVIQFKRLSGFLGSNSIIPCNSRINNSKARSRNSQLDSKLRPTSPGICVQKTLHSYFQVPAIWPQKHLLGQKVVGLSKEPWRMSQSFRSKHTLPMSSYEQVDPNLYPHAFLFLKAFQYSFCDFSLPGALKCPPEGHYSI